MRVLEEKEMIHCLEAKLLEEAYEYIEYKSVEELADVLEVIYALCEITGVSNEELERTRAIKEIARGAFKDRFFFALFFPRVKTFGGTRIRK